MVAIVGQLCAGHVGARKRLALCLPWMTPHRRAIAFLHPLGTWVGINWFGSRVFIIWWVFLVRVPGGCSCQWRALIQIGDVTWLPAY